MDNLVNFEGVLSPIPTPFEAKNGGVYEKGVYNLLNFLKGNGVHGVFSMGSYGSFPLLDPQERKQAMVVIAKACKELDLFNVMHIGAAGTAQALRYSELAHELEVDAIASVSPFYYSGHAYRWVDIFNYHKTLINNSSLPYCVYNNPRTTSFSLEAENVKELMDFGASGLKDSGNDTERYESYMKQIDSDRFNCMPGSGSTMLESFDLGAKAIVAGTSVCFPSEVVGLFNAIKNDAERSEVEKLQDIILQCRSRQESIIMRPAAAYLILKEKGVDIGVPKSPWPTSEE